MKRKSSDMSQNSGQDRQEKRMKNPSFALGYVGDPRLVPRVQQYLEGQRNKKTVDIISMSDDLQAKFSEYGRKKRRAFRKSVQKAYEQIVQLTQEPENGDSLNDIERQHLEVRRRNAQTSEYKEDTESSGDFSEDSQEYTTYEDKNVMNSFMRDLYKKPGSRSGSQAGSRPGSGINTPVGSQSPNHLVDKDVPTPLFIMDRTGNRGASVKMAASKQKPLTPPNAKEKPLTSSTKFQASPGKRTAGGSPVPKSKPFLTIDLTDEQGSNKVICHRQEPRQDMHSKQGHVGEKVLGVPTTDSQAGTAVLPSIRPIEKTGETSDASSENKKVKPTDTPQRASDTPKPSTKKRRKLDHDEEKERKKKGPQAIQSKVTFADVGGNDKMLTDICKLLVHLKHPEVYTTLGVTPPQGLLLHGPPGCGKTLLAHAIAGELELPFIKVASTEIVSGVSGESEEKLRETFQNAMASAPCVLFIDEIDAITPKRETASKDMERRIVSQLLTCMDDLNATETAHVLVIGATNRPDSLDPALRRAGRFDREISLGIPDQGARERILRVLCKTLRLTPEFDFVRLAQLTPGFVGADLMALAREAAITAVNRVFQKIQNTEPCQSEGRIENEESTPSPLFQNKSLQNPGTSQTANPPSLCKDIPDVSSPCKPAIVLEAMITDNEPDREKQLSEDTQQSQTLSTDLGIINLTNSLPAKGSMQEMSAVEKMETDLSSVQEDHTVRKVAAEEKDQSSAHKDDEVVTSKVVDTDEGKDRASNFMKSLQRPTGLESRECPQDDLQTVLRWLKDQPPLTEEQLQHLWISMEDFEGALRLVQPSAKREGFATIPDVTWDDIGALKDVREELQMAILAPVRHPKQFLALGLTSPPGILLAGPPGCGKTLLAKAVANESGINFISVKGPELLNMYVGESERAVRQVFQRARNSAPCVIFFDELDALCPRRSDSGEGGSSVRVVNQLLTEMDGLEERKQVFIMGATNRPDIIDPAVLRPGRLDKTLYVGLPSPDDRLDILNTITKNGTKPEFTKEVSLAEIAHDARCDGYTGADLAALVREAAVTALRDFLSSPEKVVHQQVVVSANHFATAFSKIRPSVSQQDKKRYEHIRGRLGIP